MLSEKERKLYTELFKKVKNRNNHINNYGQLTICPAIAGNDYSKLSKEQPRIMIVGRAINGWCPLCEDETEESFVKRIETCSSIGLDWTIGTHHWSKCQGCLYGNKKIEEKGKDAISNGNNTHFWQMVAKICEKEGIKKDGEDDKSWINKIIWTNLYKASYVEGGNPTDFYEDQIEICNELLKIEIEDKYLPEKVYFITEVFCKSPSKENRTWFCETYKRNPELNFEKVYKCFYEDSGRDAIVLMRPEYRNKDEIWEKRQNINGETIKDDK